MDFLSGNERYSVVELMRVARYCVYVSTSARFNFAINAGFFWLIPDNWLFSESSAILPGCLVAMFDIHSGANICLVLGVIRVQTR